MELYLHLSILEISVNRVVSVVKFERAWNAIRVRIYRAYSPTQSTQSKAQLYNVGPHAHVTTTRGPHPNCAGSLLYCV